MSFLSPVSDWGGGVGFFLSSHLPFTRLCKLGDMIRPLPAHMETHEIRMITLQGQRHF